MEGSACRRSHSMVSPSERRPSSRVSWNTRAAHRAGILTRRPRPFTLVWRSLVGRAFDFRGRAIWVSSKEGAEAPAPAVVGNYNHFLKESLGEPQVGNKTDDIGRGRDEITGLMRLKRKESSSDRLPLVAVSDEYE
ncbi:hypothetical protein RJ639_023471 [Escallonia herrerae]|uniref:Uncharacterized protein n=1 Tax=Escallonia herrerae TaxID=1293975 RepID=A0AA88V058_9ASTE|nr:hypothetical protein RJ639_023471 [Escallonia herrerae]